mgnify:CR=1 FL=1
MNDLTFCFIIWLVVTFVACCLATGCYLWLSRVARFENRKKEILVGVVLCALAVSSLMFLPIMFSKIDLHLFGENLTETINSVQEEALENGEKIKFAPFVKRFAHLLAAIPLKYIRLIMIGVPAIVSILIIVFTVIILFKIREPKKETECEYTRKHLFEYNPQIVTDLNKKK